MMNFLPLIASLLTQFMPEKKREKILHRIIVSILGSIFLITSVILGFLVLYQHLKSLNGEIYALFSLCILFLIIGSGAFIVGMYLKPKKVSSPDYFSNLLKAFSNPAHQDLSKKLFSVISPKMLIGIVASIAVISLFSHREKQRDE